MCGIFGYWSKEGNKSWINRKNFIQQTVYAGTVRGNDGTGLAFVRDKFEDDKENIVIYKKPIPGYDFLNLKPLDKYWNTLSDYKVVIGHNRHATQGTAITANTHPFQHKHITLVHNGHITSGLDIDKDWYKFAVDSEFICHAIAEHGYAAVLPKLNGAAALAWYDSVEDALFLYRNKERSLYFTEVKGEETILFATELPMIKWLADRNGIELDKFWDVGEDQVLIFKDKKDVKAIKIDRPKPAKVLTYQPRDSKGKYNAKGGFTKKESEDFLAGKGLRIGLEIEFVFDEVVANHEKSRHGILSGYMQDAPYLDVVSQGVALDTYTRDEILKGTIYWVQQSPRGWHSLAVREIKTTGIKATSYKRQDKNTQVIITEALKDTTKGEVPVIGPNGRLIPLSVYKDYTKHGCCKCSCDIITEDAKLIDWVGNSPVCAWCARTLGSLLC